MDICKPKAMPNLQIHSDDDVVILVIKNIVTKVKIVKVKNGTSSKIFKRIKVNKSTGAVTFTKGKYNKKTYSVKLKITASENATYRTKTITKLVKIKIK